MSEGLNRVMLLGNLGAEEVIAREVILAGKRGERTESSLAPDPDFGQGHAAVETVAATDEDSEIPF